MIYNKNSVLDKDGLKDLNFHSNRLHEDSLVSAQDAFEDRSHIDG